MKRILFAAALCLSVIGPSASAAEAGPLRNRIKSVLSHAKSDVGGVLRAGAAVTRCALKGKGRTVIC